MSFSLLRALQELISLGTELVDILHVGDVQVHTKVVLDHGFEDKIMVKASVGRAEAAIKRRSRRRGNRSALQRLSPPRW